MRVSTAAIRTRTVMAGSAAHRSSKVEEALHFGPANPSTNPHSQAIAARPGMGVTGPRLKRARSGESLPRTTGFSPPSR